MSLQNNLLLKARFVGGRRFVGSRALATHVGKSLNSLGTHASESDLPLKGVKVLELGQLIAGPFAGQLLG